MTFHTKKLTVHFLFAISIFIYPLPHPKFIMSSPVVTVKEGVKMKNQAKKKIGVGSVVTVKVGELDNIKRERIIRRMMKEVVGFFQSVVGNEKLLFQFEYGQKN